MSKGYENFNSTETSFRKSSLIQERIGLVSTHMYKQFLDYQHAMLNTTENFSEMIDNLKDIADSLKQSFSSRGITTENIYVEHDKDKSVVVINILWHTISLTTRCNYEPQALHREGATPMFSGRIMAINGNYNELMDGITSRYDNRTSACAGFRYTQREIFISCAVVINREIISFKGSYQCSYCRIGRIRLGDVCTASLNFILRKFMT